MMYSMLNSSSSNLHSADLISRHLSVFGFYRAMETWQFRIGLLCVTTLGADWVYWPSNADFGRPRGGVLLKAVHLGGVFCLLLHQTQCTRNLGFTAHSKNEAIKVKHLGTSR